MPNEDGKTFADWMASGQATVTVTAPDTSKEAKEASSK